MINSYYSIQAVRIETGQRILGQTLEKLGLPPEIPKKDKDKETPEYRAARIARKKEREEIMAKFVIRLKEPEAVEADNEEYQPVGVGNKRRKKKTIIPTPEEEATADIDTEDDTKDGKKPKDFLSMIIDDYRNITDFMALNHASVKKALTDAGTGIITDQGEMELIDAYVDLLHAENRLMAPIKRAVRQHPLWDGFLSSVKGCGELMAAVILAYIEIHRTQYVSSIWKYAGLDVVLFDEDGIIRGEGRSRKATHLVDVKFTNKKGEVATRKSITFNPELKTKLTGVLGTCFMRSGSYYYTDVYMGYKLRLQNMSEHKTKTKGHIHAMANRYMVKQFIQDLFIAWKFIIGHVPSKPYHEDVLGMEPHSKTSPYLKPVLEKHMPGWIRG
jgi:hypothetical protein